MKRLTRFVVWITAMFLVATRVWADPIRITSGSLQESSDSLLASLSITGTRGFSVNASGDRLEGRVDFFDHCNPCLPGSTVSLGAFLGDSAFSGSVTFDGRTFALRPSIDQPTVLSLEWTATTVAPRGNGGPVTLRAPFTLNGLLILSFGNETVPVSGSGIVTALLTPTHLDPDFPFLWEANRIRYDFGPATVTPEPATLLLVGTGVLAGAVGRRRTRRA